jgi:hypothetical protein
MLSNEHVTMNTSIRKHGPALARSRRLRLDGPGVSEESPYALYLRLWFARRAVQHLDLLRNIEAATKLDLPPAKPLRTARSH